MTLHLKIEQDTDLCNPRTEWDSAGKMVCFHKKHNLGDEHNIKHDDFNNWDEMEEYIVKDLGAVVILPLYLYDHSGITMRTTPFGDRFDSGQVGFIYMDRRAILSELSKKRVTKKAKEWTKKCLEIEVETYDKYLTGDVYGWVVEDDDGEEVDSCWGFFGEEHAKEEGEAALKALVENEAVS